MQLASLWSTGDFCDCRPPRNAFIQGTHWTSQEKERVRQKYKYFLSKVHKVHEVKEIPFLVLIPLPSPPALFTPMISNTIIRKVVTLRPGLDREMCQTTRSESLRKEENLLIILIHSWAWPHQLSSLTRKNQKWTREVRVSVNFNRN